MISTEKRKREKKKDELSGEIHNSLMVGLAKKLTAEKSKICNLEDT